MLLYKISKTLYILFIFYIGIFSKIFFVIPNMSLVLGTGMIVFLVFEKFKRREKISFLITKPIFIFFFFILYISFASLLVAHDKRQCVSSIITYLQIVAMMFYIINVSEMDESNKFFTSSFFLFAVIYMMIMLFYGVPTIGGRLRLSTSSNPNGDALVLFFGAFCGLIIFNFERLGEMIFSMLSVPFFAYGIVLTGSRKSFIAIVLLSILWLAINFKKYWQKYLLHKKLLSGLFLLVFIVILLFKFVPLLMESSFYQRAVEKGLSISQDQVRAGMYKEAMYFFKESPLLGIGFNQYRILSIYGTYSHSTYAELLSTTGIIGTIIYFWAYVNIIYNLIYVYVKKKGTRVSSKAMSYLILMLIMLVLATGIIHFYDIFDNIMIALMISFSQIEKLKIKQEQL